VLQERTFERVGGEQGIEADARVVAASKQPLAALAAAGEFREDLYYRLNTICVRLPPLRERGDDLPILIEHFLQRLALKHNRAEMTLSPEVLTRLQAYHWPGNIRELEHLLEGMVVLNRKSHFDVGDLPDLRPGGRTELVDLSLDGVQEVDLPAIVEQVEDRLVLWALARSDGNLAKAAQMLGIPRSTLQYKVGRNAKPSQPSA
jgi:DNA-binding NtrC family response regulator